MSRKHATVSNKVAARQRARRSAAAALPGLAPLTTAILSVLGSQVAHASGTVIAPDGRTDTQVDRQGGAHDVHTNTRSGANAFNSFYHFKVQRSDTVNLHLAPTDENLINLVRNSRVMIDGNLNSIKDGKLGAGNVVFADPHGFVVGSSGVVNVGSMMVSTPTAQFMDRVIDGDGNIDQVAVAQLLGGEAPQTDAMVSVQGTINVGDAIRLAGGSVEVEGEIRAGAAAHQAVFDGSVNTDGLEDGSAMVVDGGTISIVGDSAASVAGTLDVSGGDGQGGGVTVTAGESVKVTETARVEASGGAGGGTVVIGGESVEEAAGKTAIADGAQVSADATEAGDGGQVYAIGREGMDFSGQISARGGRESGDGGFVEVSADSGLLLRGQVDLGAEAGRTGSLLIDPAQLNIVEGGADDSTADA
ncbi:MAG: leukotoxin LktA family filamentous adhesin, partial [Pseudomonadota bacterium]